MTEEKQKEIRKFYQKKRFIIPSGLILFFVAIGIWAQKEINTLIDECNTGSIESCKKLEDTYPSSYDSKVKRSKITNPYFTDKFKKLDEIQDSAEIEQAKEEAEKKRKIDEANRKNAEEIKRRNESVLKMKLCKELLKKNLKDPSSYKELNTTLEQFQTGLIRYSATNSFGGRIQEVFNSNAYELQ